MSSVAAIILAAGASSRLGTPKQLVIYEGENLLARAIRIALEAGCHPVLVVLGSSAENIRSQTDLTRTVVVKNANWADGMASTIRCGITDLPENACGAIITTCDQPATTADHLHRLATQNRAQCVASSYPTSTGHRHNGVPAYFPASTFPELQKLHGDSGARELLANAESVPLQDGELDLDTPQDLELILARGSRRVSRLLLKNQNPS